MVFNNLILQWSYLNKTLTTGVYQWTFPIALNSLYCAVYQLGKKVDASYENYFNQSTYFDCFRKTTINLFLKNDRNAVEHAHGFLLAIGI